MNKKIYHICRVPIAFFTLWAFLIYDVSTCCASTKSVCHQMLRAIAAAERQSRRIETFRKQFVCTNPNGIQGDRDASVIAAMAGFIRNQLDVNVFIEVEGGGSLLQINAESIEDLSGLYLLPRTDYNKNYNFAQVVTIEVRRTTEGINIGPYNRDDLEMFGNHIDSSDEGLLQIICDKFVKFLNDPEVRHKLSEKSPEDYSTDASLTWLWIREYVQEILKDDSPPTGSMQPAHPKAGPKSNSLARYEKELRQLRYSQGDSKRRFVESGI